MTIKDPGSIDKLPLDDLLGALLLFDVHEHVQEVQTAFGPASPIRCDVYVLDGPHQNDQYVDTLIFPRVLIGQLRGSVGEKVLGRLGRGVAKAGQSPPWRLDIPNDMDRAKGTQFEILIAERNTAITTVDEEEPF